MNGTGVHYRRLLAARREACRPLKHADDANDKRCASITRKMHVAAPSVAV